MSGSTEDSLAGERLDLVAFEPYSGSEQNNRIGARGRAKYLGLSAITLAELSPLNESIRYSAFVAGEAISHSAVVGALTFGGSTLGVETLGVLAAAPLLETEASDRIISAINKKLSKFGIKEDAKLSAITKFNLSLFGGSVVRIWAEQREDIGRTKEENIRLGLTNSAILAGVCAVQGALMDEGLNFFGLERSLEIAGAGIGVAVFNKVGRRLNEITKQKAYYENIKAIGPQLEGIDPDNFKKALHDKRTVKGNILSKSKLPVFVPIEYASWLNPDFFAKKGYQKNELAYSIIPQNSYTKVGKEYIDSLFNEAKEKGFRGGSI